MIVFPCPAAPTNIAAGNMTRCGMRRERCLRVGTLLLLCALSFPTAAATTPAQVVEAFYHDMDAGRLLEAFERIHPEDRTEAESVLPELAAGIQEHLGGLNRVETQETLVTDIFAQVTAYVKWNNGVEQRNLHSLLLHEGDWLLRLEVISGDIDDPLPEPEGPPQPLRLVNRQRINPYNVIHVPRPNPDVAHVPLETDFFVMVGVDDPADQVLADSVRILLQPDEGDPFPILERNQVFPAGYSGSMFAVNDGRYGRGLGIHIDSDIPLKPDRWYTIAVTAHSARGEQLPADEGTWRFATAGRPHRSTLRFSLDMAQGPDVDWHGAFFNALAKPSFCTSARSRLAHYDLIAEAQETYPRAWTLQRDAYLSGFEHQPDPFKNQPNIVREQETRRIVAITQEESGVVLRVEDVFGHEQYGIESDRPVSADYHVDDEILIADGIHSARAFVTAVDDEAQTVQVTPFYMPEDGWQLEYVAPLPDTPRRHAPGLFPPGGAYLRKFDPVGTPHYYWERLHYEWDIVHGQYGRHVIPRFADAIGCIAIDGQSGTTAKDLAQHHEVTRVITRHLIERYGDAAKEWPWVILNEPDLMSVYWRNEDWKELQRFYDYTSDAILRAFEEFGYDSEKVRVGGLELGAIWGARHLRLDDFLFHCSPNVDSDDAVTLNAAYADPRLDGKRSARVERLCGANNGMGAPLDFLSVHTYNASDVAAEKLIRSKERALEIDPDYYATLPVVSHETVPTWRRIVDPGAGGMYLGNGYFTSWMADYQGRLLRQGAQDERYAHGGELVLMHWPGIVKNFDTLNDTVREIQLADRTEVIPTPAFHFVNLLSTLYGGYWVFPLKQIGGHAVSGFAAVTDDALRLVMYAHHHTDTSARSDATFDVSLNMRGLPWRHLTVTQHRFDKDNNSYYHLAREHRQEQTSERDRIYTEDEFAVIAEQAQLHATHVSVHSADIAGNLRLPVTVAGNGANVITITPHGDNGSDSLPNAISVLNAVLANDGCAGRPRRQ